MDAHAGGSVLIIDDDQEMCRALAVRLAAHGARVWCAHDAAEGYIAAVRECPDVVVCDYVMPGGYGNTVMHRLRGNSVTRSIPLIVLTGRRIGGVQDYALERELRSLGAVGYLTKPVEFDELLTELRRHINLSSEPMMSC